jgi:hypothetical protein
VVKYLLEPFIDANCQLLFMSLNSCLVQSLLHYWCVLTIMF